MKKGRGSPLGKDNPNGRSKGCHRVVGWMGGWRLSVAPIDQDRAATRRAAGINVARSIADHPAPCQIKMERLGGIKQHAGCGFAARRRNTAAGVVTNFDAIDGWHPLEQHGMHRFNHRLLLAAPTDIRLVGGNDQSVASGLQKSAIICHALEESELANRVRWIGLSAPHHGLVQRAVAVQENCRPGRTHDRG